MPPKSPTERSPAKKTAKKPLIPDTPASTGLTGLTQTARKSASKRKASVIELSDDSDISQIIAEKKLKPSVPEHGSSAVNKIPTSSIIAKVDAMLQDFVDSDGPAEADVEASSVSVDLNTQSPVAFSRPRSRKKVLTEKARVVENIRASRIKKSQVPVSHNSDDDSVASDANIIDILPIERPDFGLVEPTSKADKLSSDIEWDPSPPAAAVIKDLASEGESSDSELPLVAERVPSPAAAGVPDSNNDDEDAVMSKAVQDPGLHKIYQGLPKLEHLCDVQPFSQANGMSMDRVSFSSLCEVVSESSVELIIKGLMFQRSNYFVNTAHVDPGALTVDGQNRLKIAGTNTNAICVMIGVVTECMLIDDGLVLSQSYPARKVTIAPFAQEMRRDTSLWGQVFKFHVVTTSVSASGLSFLTKKQGTFHSFSAPSSPQKHTTPQKKSALFKSIATPLIAQPQGEGSRTAPAFQYARSFDDKGVPIYVGRSKSGQPGFTFSDKDFGELQSWPLYKKGNRDLPIDAVIAVGYIVNKYSTERVAMALSLNVQFAVLLAVPAATL